MTARPARAAGPTVAMIVAVARPVAAVTAAVSVARIAMAGGVTVRPVKDGTGAGVRGVHATIVVLVVMTTVVVGVTAGRMIVVLVVMTTVALEVTAATRLAVALIAPTVRTTPGSTGPDRIASQSRRSPSTSRPVSWTGLHVASCSR